MKIGTDGVLLGAWASIDHRPKNILDIGAGTGIIALQLAQRTTTDHNNNITAIDAVEINSNAYEQCVENFEGSSWNDLLFCYHASLQEFVDEMDLTYDLIISNPPYFTDTLKYSKIDRSQARSNQSLPFDELLSAASKSLSEKGVFSVIIPYNEEIKFIDIASRFALFPMRICRVKGNNDSKIVRSLIEFSRNDNDLKIEQLTIERSRHKYTKDYVDLVRDFYLNM